MGIRDLATKAAELRAEEFNAAHEAKEAEAKRVAVESARQWVIDNLKATPDELEVQERYGNPVHVCIEDIVLEWRADSTHWQTSPHLYPKKPGCRLLNPDTMKYVGDAYRTIFNLADLGAAIKSLERQQAKGR